MPSDPESRPSTPSTPGAPFMVRGQSFDPTAFCWGTQIHPECLQIGGDGAVRVRLGFSAKHWFAGLSDLGEVLHLARNGVAVLGNYGPVPAVTDWRNPVLPRSASGRFMPNLAEYASLWAVREESPVGTAYGLEARDISGQAFQKVILTAPARRKVYEELVNCGQVPRSTCTAWHSPNHAASRQRCAVLTERVAYLSSRLARNRPEVRAVPVERLLFLLRAAAFHRVDVCTTHYSRALNVAAIWTPLDVESSGTPATPSVFVHGFDAGLQVNLSAITSAWLWRGRCQCCTREHWTVEVAGPAGQIGLAITAAQPASEESWRMVLNESLGIP